MKTQFPSSLNTSLPGDLTATIRRLLATTAALWIGTPQPQMCAD
ncbi:MAG: hypothetical protein V4713_14165 [Pseudomonadota bacterium]